MENKNYIELLDRFFRGLTSDEENNILREWIELPESQGAFSDYYSQYWELASDNMDKRIQDEIFTDILTQIGTTGNVHAPKRKIRLATVLRYAAVAACAAIIAGTGMYFLGTTNSDAENQFITMSVENGQKADIVLADGTRVYLNSDSKVVYNEAYNKKNRTLQLEGEAFFEVARNEKVPFIVQANGLAVQALGTSFNVKAYTGDKDIAVILIEGKVKVDDGASEILMDPNERLEYNLATNAFYKSDIHPNADYLLWRSNELALYGESLEEICNILTRMYNWNFIFKTESVKRYTYTGIIRNNSLDNIMSFISQTTPIKYHAIPAENTIVIDKR